MMVGVGVRFLSCTYVVWFCSSTKAFARCWFMRVVLKVFAVIKILVTEDIVCHLTLDTREGDSDVGDVNALATLTLSRFRINLHVFHVDFAAQKTFDCCFGNFNCASYLVAARFDNDFALSVHGKLHHDARDIIEKWLVSNEDAVIRHCLPAEDVP
jgi:hypothetical protein